MTDEQPRFKHDRMSQHASVCTENAHTASMHALDDVIHVHDPHPLARYDAVTYDGFLGGPYNMSLLLHNANHTVRNM